jgi:hypothetical protein
MSNKIAKGDACQLRYVVSNFQVITYLLDQDGIEVTLQIQGA